MNARNKKREASRESGKTFRSRGWLFVSLFSPFCLLILRSPAAADVQTPLTWQDCVRLAAAKNPQLLSAIRAQEASRAQYKGSYNGIFPHLSLSNSYTDSSASGLPESK